MNQYPPLKSTKKQTVLILSSKSWNRNLVSCLSNKFSINFTLISSKDQFTYDLVKDFSPDWIFVVHWNFIIPDSIWNNWKTVIFHMTDLPFGRGGSPLQNLIVRGFTTTMVSALSCSSELDAGDIYMKQSLSLDGSAEEIFIRTNSIIENMISSIIETSPTPCPQDGDVVFFKRRKPHESNLSYCPPGDMLQWYNYIRMLDAEGYPKAFLDIYGMNLEFSRVTRRYNGLYADVLIRPIDRSN